MFGKLILIWQLNMKYHHLGQIPLGLANPEGTNTRINKGTFAEHLKKDLRKIDTSKHSLRDNWFGTVKKTTSEFNPHGIR